MTTKSRRIGTDKSDHVASWSNRNREAGSLYWFEISLYRHQAGRYFLATFGGGAMARTGETHWVSDAEARRFVSEYATDISDYGYTDDEAARLLAGIPTRGTRESLTGRPDISDFTGPDRA